MSSKKRSAFHNASLNLAFPLVPMAVSLFAVPFYISLLGVERYGFLTLIWIITGLYSIADFGIGQAVRYRVATSAAMGGVDSETGRPIGAVLWSAVCFNGAIGSLLAMILAQAIGPWLFSTVDAPTAISSEVKRSIPYIVALLPIALLNSVLMNALEGKSRFLILNLSSSSTQIIITLSTLFIAWQISQSLQYIVITVVFWHFIQMTVLFVANRELTRKPIFLSLDEITNFLKFGGWSSVYATMMLLSNSLDRFIVGSTLSSAQIANYSVPFSLLERLQFIPYAILRTSFPRLAGEACDEVRNDLAFRSVTVVIALTAIVYIPLGYLSDVVLVLWIGQQFSDQSSGVMLVLALAFWIYGPLLSLFSLNVSRGQPQIPAKLRLLSIIPYALLAIYLTIAFGIFGTALALLLWRISEFLYVAVRMGFLKFLMLRMAPWLCIWLAALMGSLLELELVSELAFALALTLASVSLGFFQSSDLRSVFWASWSRISDFVGSKR